MEQLAKIVTMSVFGAGVVAFFAASGFWIATACNLTEEAKGRYRWNPLNGTLVKANLTARGQVYRTIAIRCFLAWAGLGIAAVVIVGPIMLLLNGAFDGDAPK